MWTSWNTILWCPHFFFSNSRSMDRNRNLEPYLEQTGCGERFCQLYSCEPKVVIHGRRLEESWCHRQTDTLRSVSDLPVTENNRSIGQEVMDPPFLRRTWKRLRVHESVDLLVKLLELVGWSQVDDQEKGKELT